MCGAGEVGAREYEPKSSLYANMAASQEKGIEVPDTKSVANSCDSRFNLVALCVFGFGSK